MTAPPDIPGGVWPVMVTPFRPDRSIDWNGLDRLVEWYLEAGIAGLFAVCLSSEMFELVESERLALAERVSRRVDGRVPVVASGTLGSDPEAHAEGVRRMADQGVTAVVVLASMLAAEGEEEAAWRERADRLLQRTGDIPLGLYECPRPHHRLLSPGTLAWAAETGRFRFLKETSGRQSLVKAKLEAVQGTSLRLFDACAGTLAESLRLGADGFCGISANFVPELWVWLCRHVNDEPETTERLQAFLADAEQAFALGYPASAKRFMASRGLPVGTTCRTAVAALSIPDQDLLDAIRREADGWRLELGV